MTESNKEHESRSATFEKVGIGTEKPNVLLDIRSNDDDYDAETRAWPAESQIHISPHTDDEAGAFIGSKTENHVYMAAGIKRHAKGDWEVMSDHGATIVSGLNGYHSFFSVPSGIKGKHLNPSDGIKMRISQNGNVGIGTVRPKHKLDVHGVIGGDDVVVRPGNEDLMALVGSQVPDAITSGPDDEQTVSYNTLFSHLLRVIQEQQQEIEQLKKAMSRQG